MLPLTAQTIFFTVAIVAAYLYWVRPVLRSRPELKQVYDRSDGLRGALRLRFAGIKTRLLAVVSMAAAAIVVLHDFVLANAFGIDWTPVRDLLPAWAWPFILFADFWLISKFRLMTDRRRQEGL
jgi:hypothetical protein